MRDCAGDGDDAGDGRLLLTARAFVAAFLMSDLTRVVPPTDAMAHIHRCLGHRQLAPAFP